MLSTVTDSRLNNFAMVNVYNEVLDEVDIKLITREFIKVKETSDIRVTYEYIRVTFGWHTSTYEWHTIYIRMTYEWHTGTHEWHTNDM